MPTVKSAEWEEFISRNPQAHLLQTRPWGDLKARFGWTTLRLRYEDCGAQILIRRIFPGISMAYIPKGPVGADWNKLIPDINQVCRHQRVAFIKIEPDAWEKSDTPTSPPSGYIRSHHNIQPPRTSIINLAPDEKTILGGMKQKTRYNINLALRKGVIVHAHTNIQLFHDLMKITGKRDQFYVHNQAYYQMAYELFHTRGECELFFAEFENEPLAALMVFAQGFRAWYLYGGSSNYHRDRMPNYLLQWEAMRWARSIGCKEYDLWGIPDVDEDTLENNFKSRDDGLWGVYRFKRGFGGEVHRSVGTWDKIFNPFLYKLYLLWMRSRQSNA